MNARAILIVVWLVTGIGAVAGSVAGAAVGERSLFIGALLGGPLGAAAGVWLSNVFGWLAVQQRRAATLGAIVGFVIAAPVAVTNLQTPIVSVLICSLAGVGALVGAGRASAKRG